MKTVTIYLSQLQYQKFQVHAKKKGKKTAELIRDAMDYYCETQFDQKQSMQSLTFDRGVSLAPGARDFLTDNWREEMMKSEVKV